MVILIYTRIVCEIDFSLFIFKVVIFILFFKLFQLIMEVVEEIRIRKKSQGDITSS